MNEKELINILENYAVFVDDDFGGNYQSIISYTKDKKISKAFTSLGALQIIDEFKQLQQENQQLKEKLEASEKARKEAIELVKNNQRKDEFVELNEWQVRDLLNILDVDKGE